MRRILLFTLSLCFIFSYTLAADRSNPVVSNLDSKETSTRATQPKILPPLRVKPQAGMIKAPASTSPQLQRAPLNVARQPIQSSLFTGPKPDVEVLSLSVSGQGYLCRRNCTTLIRNNTGNIITSGTYTLHYEKKKVNGQWQQAFNAANPMIGPNQTITYNPALTFSETDKFVRIRIYEGNNISNPNYSERIATFSTASPGDVIVSSLSTTDTGYTATVKNNSSQHSVCNLNVQSLLVEGSTVAPNAGATHPGSIGPGQSQQIVQPRTSGWREGYSQLKFVLYDGPMSDDKLGEFTFPIEGSTVLVPMGGITAYPVPTSK